MKKILSLLLVLATLFLSASQTFALTLDTIGASATTNGNPGTEWYYTAENPRLTGTAGASTTVTINIDGVEATTLADATGNWTYNTTTLTTGDHTITINGDSQVVTFTLHVGQAAPTGTTTSKGGVATDSATLPVTGAFENTLMLLGLGGIMIFAGIKLQKGAQVK